MTVHFIGIRHHSPACATLVADTIQALQPTAVLIEGPCDFNARLDELLLKHTLPIALYSYRFDGAKTAQSWFPFLSYSPEYVALQTAKKVNAQAYFIDLPHWTYRVQSAWENFIEQENAENSKQNRYAVVLKNLLATTGYNNQDMLWDSWFEQAETQALQQRLDDYFDLLRDCDRLDGNKTENSALYHDKNDLENVLREQFMARWVAFVQNQMSEKGNSQDNIVVICGGWHKPALEQLYPQFLSQFNNEKNPPNPLDFLHHFIQTHQHDPLTHTLNATAHELEHGFQGSYLIPFSYAQVDNLSGYQAGMPSPQFYEWLYQDKATAVEKAMIAITQALRLQKQPLSTADLMAWQLATQNLSHLRGRAEPTRHDLLDGFLMSGIKEALPQPPVWASDTPRRLQKTDHPAIQAILRTLSGDKKGKLAIDTPLPPLMAQVEQVLREQDLLPTAEPRQLTLYWREPADREKLHILWQLNSIGCDSVQPIATSRPSSKNAETTFNASETWQLQKNAQWEIQLIEASRFGATLMTACKNALAEKLVVLHGFSPVQSNQPLTPNQSQTSNQTASQTEATQISYVFIMAIRAGLYDWQDELVERLLLLLPEISEIEPLTQIGKTLKSLKQQGFWGGDIDRLLDKPFFMLLYQLAWLLDGTARLASSASLQQANANPNLPTSTNNAKHNASPNTLETDIQAIQLFEFALYYDFSGARQYDKMPHSLDTADILALLWRLIHDNPTRPALRGSALGVYYGFGEREDTKNDPNCTAISTEQIIAMIRRLHPKDELGDFLYGLFACARILLTQQDDTHANALVACLFEAVHDISVADFLIALPTLRMAFGWFSSGERQSIALTLAKLMKLNLAESVQFQRNLGKNASDVDSLVYAKSIEAQANEWLKFLQGV